MRWIGNYATLGPYDYLDIFEAPDPDTTTKVTWGRFLDLAAGLKSVKVAR